MSTPEKCPKCCAALKGGFSDIYNCDSAFEEDDDGWFLAQSYHCVATQRDQLAERVRELEAWKESAMAVEREWDPNHLATMLGGKIGEPQRAVIQWKVPVLVQRVKRLEEAGDAMASELDGRARTWGEVESWLGSGWRAAKGQP